MKSANEVRQIMKTMTVQGVESLIQQYAEQIDDAITEAAREGYTEIQLDLEENILWKQHNQSVLATPKLVEFLDSLITIGFSVALKPPAVMVSWSKETILEDGWRFFGGPVREGEKASAEVSPAQATLEEWENKGEAEHLKALQEATQRRPWSTYFVAPTKHEAFLISSMTANGWQVNIKRHSKCGKRVHLIVRAE